MFDPSVEPAIPLVQVPNIPWLPRRRRGRKMHRSTPFRWKDGLRGVKLEVVRIGGTLCTSEQSLKRFFARLSDAEATSPAPSPLGGCPPA